MSDVEKLNDAKRVLASSFLPDRLKSAIADVLDVVGALNARCAKDEALDGDLANIVRMGFTNSIVTLKHRVHVLEDEVRVLNAKLGGE